MLKLDEALTRLDGDRELYCQLAREFCARCPAYAADQVGTHAMKLRRGL